MAPSLHPLFILFSTALYIFFNLCDQTQCKLLKETEGVLFWFHCFGLDSSFQVIYIFAIIIVHDFRGFFVHLVAVLETFVIDLTIQSYYWIPFLCIHVNMWTTRGRIRYMYACISVSDIDHMQEFFCNFSRVCK